MVRFALPDFGWLNKKPKLANYRVKVNEIKTSEPESAYAEESKRLYESIQPFVPEAETGLPQYEPGKNDEYLITVHYVLPNGIEKHRKGIIIGCGQDYILIGSSGCDYSNIFNRIGQSRIIKVIDSKNEIIYLNKEYSGEMEAFYSYRL
jgi:hypothetical protein